MCSEIVHNPTKDREPIVTPLHPTEEERPYWESAEELLRAYCIEKGAPLTEEGEFGLFCLVSWPMFEASLSLDSSWDTWSWRFDADTFERLNGHALLDSIATGGIMEGFDPKAIVAEIEQFVGWLGTKGHIRTDLSQQIQRQISDALPTFLAPVPTTPSVFDGTCCPDCAANEAVAPFVGWLRDQGHPMAILLAGQALCINALEQLKTPSMEKAPWTELNIAVCIDQTTHQLLDDEQQAKPTIQTAAFKLLDFLRAARLISRAEFRRLAAPLSHH